MKDQWTASELSALAAACFGEGPRLMRALQRWRPYICPFDALLAQVPPGSSVLDVGCGGGLFLALLHRTGRLGCGIGFDASAPAIGVAQGMADRENDGRSDPLLSFELRETSAPWPDGPFDVVSIVDVMHHIPPDEQRNVLDLAADRVRPGGGILLYKDMCRRPRWRAWANRGHDLVLARQWIHYVPTELIRAWAEAAGLCLKREARIDRWWYGHELLVLERP